MPRTFDYRTPGVLIGALCWFEASWVGMLFFGYVFFFVRESFLGLPVWAVKQLSVLAVVLLSLGSMLGMSRYRRWRDAKLIVDNEGITERTPTGAEKRIEWSRLDRIEMGKRSVSFHSGGIEIVVDRSLHGWEEFRELVSAVSGRPCVGSAPCS